MQKNVRVSLGLVVIIILLASACTYQLREGSVAVVTRLGSPNRTETEAGLHLRYPWPIENTYKFDNRKRVLETSFTETLTRDKKNVILLNYAIWDIKDPQRFLEKVGDPQSAEIKLDGLITNAKNAVMGNYDLDALVSTEHDSLKVPEIESQILAMIQPAAEDQFGVNIEEVAILRLALPEENISRVFEQMRAERQQSAAEQRAEGELRASEIRSATDLESARIIADAQETAARIKAEAEGDAAEIYADAHSLDPEFYAFLRSLEALEAILGENTTLVLDTDSAPFNLLEADEDAEQIDEEVVSEESEEIVESEPEE